jgi:type IV secretion system protein VirB8
MRADELEEYYGAAERWSADRQRSGERSRRLAWIAASVAAAIALLEAVALVAIIPLQREVPYTLLVDRQTGHVEALRPLEEQRLTADAALTRSFLVQYVTARESFDRNTLQENYRRVGLMSAEEARERYLAQMRAGNPGNPLASLPPGGTIDVRIRSVSSLSPNTALVRFDTIQSHRAAQSQQAQNWAAIIRYRYSEAGMSAADRLVNPLGFQVVRYRRDAETLPEVLQALPPAPAAAAPNVRAERTNGVAP